MSEEDTAEIGVEAWAAEEAERLRRFVIEWKENCAVAPDQWPERMTPGEWDEQFRAEYGA